MVPERPHDWTEVSLGEVVPRAEYGISESLGPPPGIPILRMNNFRDGEAELSDLKFSSGAAARDLLLAPGDVLFNRTNSIDHVGRTGIWRGQIPKASFASYLVRLEVDRDRIDPHFLNRWLNWAPTQQRIRAFATPGVHQVNINPTNLRRTRITLPTALREQRQIAAVLDTLDSAIRKTEQIIAKLKQVKQGLLHDLLTRGIDGNGELRDPTRHPDQFKDSPLGRIPREWGACALGTALARIEAGKSPSCPDRPALGDEWGVLKVSAVRPHGFQPRENKAIINAVHVEPAFEVRHGDLLITRANTYELVGLACLVENPPPRLLLSDKTLRLVVDNSKADVRFVFYTLQLPYVRAQIETHATGSSGSMKNIGQETIRALQVKLPPKPEQVAIANRLRAFDERADRERASVAKAHALKAGLMEDLLTGSVRVQ